MRRALLLASWIAIAGVAAASPVSAESMWDLQVGGAFTSSAPVQIFSTEVATQFEDSVSFDVQYGYWFPGPAKWLGIGIGASYFRADPVPTVSFPTLDARIWVVPVTPQLMIRIPLLTSDDLPGGMIQPYIGAGPSFTASVARVVGPVTITEGSFDVGADARAGVAVQVARPIALLAEYRFTHVDVDFDGRMQAVLQTHHVYGGVSFRY